MPETPDAPPVSAGRRSRMPGSRLWRVRHGLALGLAIGIGTALGIGSFTFRYASGLSYLSADPKACVNCHIMRSQYDGWQKASHHTVAVCIDCHLPHDFMPKYFAKAENGYRHSERFTTGAFVEPIRVQPRGLAILEANCRRCHAALAAEISHGDATPGRELSCLHCHFSVGHGESARLGAPLNKTRNPE